MLSDLEIHPNIRADYARSIGYKVYPIPDSRELGVVRDPNSKGACKMRHDKF